MSMVIILNRENHLLNNFCSFEDKYSNIVGNFGRSEFSVGIEIKMKIDRNIWEEKKKIHLIEH